MNQKIIFFLLSILNITEFANAQVENTEKKNLLYVDEKNVIIRIDKEQNTLKDSLIKALSNSGVYIDQLSQVATHEEKTYIDISCFNCIITNKLFSNTIQHSENDIVTGKKFDKAVKIPNNSGQ